MKRSWLPWIVLIAVFSSAQFWGNLWKRTGDGTLTPANEASAAGNFVPPDCPSDTSSLRFGATCKNLSTGNVCIKDGAGLFNVRGGGPC